MIDFAGRTAIVTGAGGGLGRAYALALAARGANLVVNDPGVTREGAGRSDSAAAVVSEIQAAGGRAIADAGSVTDYADMQAMAARAMEAFGSIDILINNAGILRDKSFGKMEMEDFRAVLDVHLLGAAHASKAVWEHMRGARYGRILMATSAAGMWGNFGQANYAAAKAGLIGLARTLGLEGARENIRVNCVAPVAGTRMLEDIMPGEMLGLFAPEDVVPAVLYLVSEDAPKGTIIGAGGGHFHAAHIGMTRGVHLPPDQRTPEGVAAAFAGIVSREGEKTPAQGMDQVTYIAANMQEK